MRDISVIVDQTNLKVLRNRLVTKEVEKAYDESKLSKRELDVLHLLGGGNSNIEIARQLELSVKTISTYRSRLIQKLGLESSIALTQYASKR